MYIGTRLGRVIALHAETGAERWVFDPEIRRDVAYGDFAYRGVSMWNDDRTSVLGPSSERVDYGGRRFAI